MSQEQKYSNKNKNIQTKTKIFKQKQILKQKQKYSNKNKNIQTKTKQTQHSHHTTIFINITEIFIHMTRQIHLLFAIHLGTRWARCADDFLVLLCPAFIFFIVKIHLYTYYPHTYVYIHICYNIILLNNQFHIYIYMHCYV